MRRRFIIHKGFTETFDFNNYLTIEALEDNLTVTFSNDIEYGIDGNGWMKLRAYRETSPINTGQTLSFRGEFIPSTAKGIGAFTINKKCNLKGNCMSMLFGDNAVNNYSLSGKDWAFYRLFYNCSNIVNIDSNFLPATTLASDCYESMFENCKSLTTAPSLPATTLASGCYSYMFSGCKSLTTAPALPATTLANNCYYQMFGYCTNLTTAPELPTTTLASGCYNYMFSGCTNLTAAPALPATALADYCYSNMFSGCTNLTTAPAITAAKLASNCYSYMFSDCKSLTTAPELPAKTLMSYCYERMFMNCTKLNYIKMLATNISATGCLSNWVNGVSSTGTFVKNKRMTSLPTGVSGIPSGWTVNNFVIPIFPGGGGAGN